MNAIAPQITPPENKAEITALEGKIALLEQMLERERENSDEWRKQAQQLALAPPSEDRRNRRFLGFLWKID